MNNNLLIKLPTIYNAGGALSKKWFIEFYVRNPKTNKLERQRMFKGINSVHTLKGRIAAAEKMKQHWTDKLKAGWTPFIDQNIIYDDNLEYQTFIKNYRLTKSKNGTFRFFASKYIDSIKNEIEKTTVVTYRSKLRLFDAFLQNEYLNEVDVSAISQKIMAKFMGFIIEERKLSKSSVDNYRNLINNLFEFIRKERKQFPNPCVDLPGTKRVNDSAAEPIRESDIGLLKKEIFKKDPQLWLVICFEYYCFMRPRKEIRFLKIGDIDFDRGMIKIRYENAKTEERWVNIPSVFLKLMKEDYKLHTYDRDLYVFSKNGKPGKTIRNINDMTNRFVKFRDALKLPKMYKLYSWKHTGNIMAEKSGISLRELQEQNGHTTIATTEIYFRKMKANQNPNVVNKFPEI